MEPEAAWTLWEIEDTVDYADHSIVTVPTGILQQCVDKLFRATDVGDFVCFSLVNFVYRITNSVTWA